MKPPPIETPQTSPARLHLEPSFMGALRGIWSFTWRANLNSTRLAATLLLLLILPVLVFLTTASPDAWVSRETALGAPESVVRDLARHLRGAGVRISPKEYGDLRRIFSEEFATSEPKLRSIQTDDKKLDVQRAEIAECYSRIGARVQGVLKPSGLEAYQTFEKARVARSQAKVREGTWNRTEPFYRWLIDLYFFVILPLNCARACGGLIRDELQANTLGFLITRPVSRAKLVIAKYLAQVGWLQIVFLVEALLLFAVGAMRGVPDLLRLLPLFIAAQVLAVLAWCGLGFLLGQVTKRYMAAALLYGLVVEIGIAAIPTNINNLSLIGQLKGLLAHNDALLKIFSWTVKPVFHPSGILLLAAVLFIAAAALLFTYREYHHAAEMQK